MHVGSSVDTTQKTKSKGTATGMQTHILNCCEVCIYMYITNGRLLTYFLVIPLYLYMYVGIPWTSVGMPHPWRWWLSAVRRPWVVEKSTLYWELPLCVGRRWPARGRWALCERVREGGGREGGRKGAPSTCTCMSSLAVYTLLTGNQHCVRTLLIKMQYALRDWCTAQGISQFFTQTSRHFFKRPVLLFQKYTQCMYSSKGTFYVGIGSNFKEKVMANSPRTVQARDLWGCMQSCPNTSSHQNTGMISLCRVDKR